jgi:hypothetical protein
MLEVAHIVDHHGGERDRRVAGDGDGVCERGLGDVAHEVEQVPVE